MFDIWEVVEELVTVADERGSKTISMSQIGEELKDAEQNNARNVQEVRKSLVELGYRVEVQSLGQTEVSITLQISLPSIVRTSLLSIFPQSRLHNKEKTSITDEGQTNLLDVLRELKPVQLKLVRGTEWG